MKKIKGINIFTLVLVGLGLLSSIVGLTLETGQDYGITDPNFSIGAESFKEYELGWSDTKLSHLTISIECENTVENGTLFLYIAPITGATGANLAQFYDGGTTSESYFVFRSCQIRPGYKVFINFDILLDETENPPEGPIRVIVIPVDLVNSGLVQEPVDMDVSIDATWDINARVLGKNIFLFGGLAMTLSGLTWGFVQIRKNQDK